MMNGKFKKRCVIISGAPDADADFISQNVRPTDYVICADSGTRVAARAHITPDLVVSDFDSEPNVLFADCETVCLKPEKAYTDTMHAAMLALERGYEDILILNAVGGRLDHTLGNLFVLVYIARSGGKAAVLSPSERVEFLTEGKYEYKNLEQKTFSLFPLACDAVRVSYKGVKYPLESYEVKSGDLISVSNVFLSNSAEITVHSGCALVAVDLNT